NSATATVTITVNDNSTVTAKDDSASTNENTAVTVNVLANDSDSDGDALTVSAKTNGSHGGVVINADNTVTYTPTTGYHGSDSFTYVATDDGGVHSASATVSLTVVDNSTVTAVNDSYSTNESTTLSVAASGVLANDSDSLGNPISVNTVNGSAA